MREAAISAFEFLGFLPHAILQRVRPLEVFRPRLLQFLGHVVEGNGQTANLVLARLGQHIIQVALGHVARALGQPAHGLVNRQPDQPGRKEAYGQDGGHGENHHPALMLSHRQVSGRQRYVGVQYAQHPAAPGMGVAGGVRAVGLVFNGPDKPQHSRAVARAVNTHAVRPVEPHQRLSLGVAGVARLSLLIHEAANFLVVGGKADLSFLVENTDAVDAVLVPDGVDDMEHFLALIAQHRIANAAADGVANAVRPLKDDLLLGLPPEAQVPISIKTKQQRHAADHASRQLDRQATG